MSTVDLRLGDNARTLAELKASGEKFDLVEVDGPYMAGLEDWDTLTEAQYIEHYAERLALVRDVLQPWGVVFVFGYPEGCAEIKSWAHRSGMLNCRRWLSWYLNQTAHSGRKVQAVLCLENYRPVDLWEGFKSEIRRQRTQRGMTVKQAMIATDIRADKVTSGERGGGGFLWYEAPSSLYPTPDEYARIKRLFDVPSEFDILQSLGELAGVTNLDFITVPPERAAHLNDAGLRSKPVQLYLDLFRPTIPPTASRRALVLYGGSGNAGIAAAALGYDVTMCEASAERCELIRGRWAGEVAKWTQKANAHQPTLFAEAQAQPALFQVQS